MRETIQNANGKQFHAVSLSGGKDSTAMLLLMIERDMPINMVLSADTGMEFPEMYEHLAKLDEHLFRERGIHITTLRHPKGFEYLMFDEPKQKPRSLENRAKLGIPPYGNGWPGIRVRWCTGQLKTHLITKDVNRLERAGAPGTTAALALLNDAVKKGGVMASGHVGGLSGAFIPVSEDAGMIEAARSGALSLEKLEAMTCVCSVGIDMVAVPGATSADTIAGIIADEAAIGMINQKTTAVRIIPVPGKDVGDTVAFGGLLGTAPVMRVNGCDNAAFIARGGRIPAPIHSLRN